MADTRLTDDWEHDEYLPSIARPEKYATFLKFPYSLRRRKGEVLASIPLCPLHHHTTYSLLA